MNNRVCILLASLLTGVMATSSALADGLDVIPKPRNHTIDEGSFKFESSLSFSGHGVSATTLAFFASEFRKVTGWKVPVSESGVIHFIKDDGIEGGYQLHVSKQNIQIKASDDANLFYGFQTLRQLGPAALFGDACDDDLSAGWSIPCVTIDDGARFPWRGVLVDVSRHFQTKAEMLKLLDSMSIVKLNVLHWHLTDDQGWRPEIKAYPKLTAGSSKYYSQDDLREIVAYATQRGISIVPEIDVPGHSGAVAKAYPELCVAKPGNKGRHNVYDVSNPEVYVFLDTVFKELSSIFPDAYIHLGADEVGKRAWAQDKGVQQYMKENNISNLHGLQSDFVGKVCKLIKKYDRKPIAWDEALEGGADKELTIMSWRGVQPGMKAARDGHKVVVCPVSALYYDRAQSRSNAHPRGYSANTVGLSQSYFFEPRIPTLPESAKANILGAQGCVWGEWIQSGDHLQRQVMLRGAALSEALWSPREALDWEDFNTRLRHHRKRLDAKGIPYWWEPESTPVLVSQWDAIGKMETRTIDISKHVSKAGLYEFLFHYKNGKGSFNVHQAELLVNGEQVSKDDHVYTATVEGRRPSQYYQLTLADFKKDATYQLRYRVEPVKGGSSGVVMLVPPLQSEAYSPARSPSSNANKSNQKQPDEL